MFALIIGPPGGGKGTISERITKEFHLGTLGSGDMIRSQIRQQTPVRFCFLLLFRFAIACIYHILILHSILSDWQESGGSGERWAACA